MSGMKMRGVAFHLTVMFAIYSTFRKSTSKILVSANAGHGTVARAAASSVPASSLSNSEAKRIFKTLQVQIVHRHGDRTPITPMKDEEFWAKTLIPPAVLDMISSDTELIKSDVENTHKAGGRGPFGKLTQLGLLQMIELGTRLREQLATDKTDDCFLNDEGDLIYPHLWTPERPLTAASLKVYSTDFPRTIQSVQGLIVGLFPDGASEKIPIDIRHTNMMIPDPQPRQTREQERLEETLARRPHLIEREKELLPLATKATKALHPLLGANAHEVSFGVDLQEHPSDVSIEIEPLAWNQLAEISTCLAVRNLLPAELTMEDHEAICEHAAHRWFENLRHPRLCFLSMNKFVSYQLQHLVGYKKEPCMIIWSAHDSTLIGLLCAYRLEQPTEWPDYGSCLQIELLQVTCKDNEELFVRFSLNGQILKSEWSLGDDCMIPLSLLVEKCRTSGSEHPVATTSSL